MVKHIIIMNWYDGGRVVEQGTETILYACVLHTHAHTHTQIMNSFYVHQNPFILTYLHYYK